MRRTAKSRGGPPRLSWDAWQLVTDVLLTRDGSFCGWCGREFGTDGVRHHRMRRREGGDGLANLVLLHDACHKEVHASPAFARDRGFIVSVHGDSTRQPIEFRGVWFRLLEDGTRERMP